MYMAPEIHMKASYYHGIPIDIFAAGIILFIMVTGFPPFKMATPKDACYNLICTNKHDKFWDYQQKKRKVNIEQDFRDLMNPILSFDPTHRPSIAEIVTSDWWNKETATIDQVKQEFENRKLKVMQAREAERQQEIAMREAQKNMNNEMGNMNWRGVAVRNDADDEEDEENDNESTIWDDIVTKVNEKNFKDKLPEYKEDLYRPSTLYSNLDAITFFKVMMFAVTTLGGKPTINLDKKRIKVSIQSEYGVVKFNVDMKEEYNEKGMRVAVFNRTEGPGVEFFEFVSEIQKKIKELTVES